MTIKYYAGNRLTGEDGDSKPTTLPTGSTFLETNTDDLYMWDGDSWNIVAGNTITETLSSKTLTSPVLNTGLSGTAFLDEDDFSSDSANKAASQQSIKAYVATQITGSQNLFSTIAVSGQSNVVADAATDTLTFAAGSNISITTNASSDTVTISSATGVSAFDGLSDVTLTSPTDASLLLYDTGTSVWRDAAMSGDATISDTGALTIAATAIEGSMLNSNTVDDSSIQLASNTLNVKASGVTNAMLAGSIVNAKLTNSSITVSDGSNTSPVSLGGTLTFTATANETTIVESAGTVTIGLPNNVTIGGNLIVTGNSTVNGDTITQNVATVLVEDPLMALASGNNAADAVDIGFYGLYDTSGSLDLYSGLFRDANDSGKWKLFKDLQAVPTTTVNVSGTGYAVGTLVANLEGDVTGDITGTTTEATNITAVANNSTDETVYPTFVDGATGTQGIETDTGLTYNPSTGTMTSTVFVGALTGNAATATEATNVTAVANNSTNETVYPTFIDGATGTQGIETDTGLTYNPSTGVLTSTTFTGAVSGNATTATALATSRTISASGDITWTSASFDGSANVTSVAAITADVIVNADVKSDAAIVDTKLATISTADKVSIAALNINGVAEIGAAIVDADLFIIDDGGGGTNRHTLASRLKTYIGTLGDANEYAFKTISVSGQTDVVADTTTDTLTLVAGANMTITTSGDSITLVGTETGASNSFAFFIS